MLKRPAIAHHRAAQTIRQSVANRGYAAGISALQSVKQNATRGCCACVKRSKNRSRMLDPLTVQAELEMLANWMRNGPGNPHDTQHGDPHEAQQPHRHNANGEQH